MIKLENISKQFDNTVVLKNVNIEFEPEKTYAIIGSSGAGKSTLLRCINLLEKPSTGNVIVDGVNIIKDKEHLSTIREKIGMVFQNFNLFAHMSAKKNVMFALLKVKKMTFEEAEKEAESWTDCRNEAPASGRGCGAVRVFASPLRRTYAKPLYSVF